MDIDGMLNHNDASEHGEVPDSTSSTPKAYNTPSPSTARTDKVPKDGFIAIKSELRAAVLYPPHEVWCDDETASKLRSYYVVPDPSMGKFSEYPRFIPYTSSKKDFLNKTGLKGFNVFQYEFFVYDTTNNKSKRHLVLWDYQVGLVRITPFFKALKYSKTTPKKVLDLNDGLAELTVSITGGSLAAQGYWMPFECAKAVATTFCYHIRHLLTPIFGTDFPDQCLPDDHPDYCSFVIDPSIVQACKTNMGSWRLSGNDDNSSAGPNGSLRSPDPSHHAKSDSMSPVPQRQLRPRTRGGRSALGSDAVRDSEHGRGIDPGTGDVSSGSSSTTIVAGSDWTSINRAKRSWETQCAETPESPMLRPETPTSMQSKLGQADTSGYHLRKRRASKAACVTRGEASSMPDLSQYSEEVLSAAQDLLQLRYGDNWQSTLDSI